MTSAREAEQPPTTVRIPPPPELGRGEGLSVAVMGAIPMVGSLGSILLVTSMAGQPGADHGRRYLAAGLFLLSTIAFVAVQLARQRGQRTRQVADLRTDYLLRLFPVREQLREAAHRQRATLARHHPDPGVLPAVAAACQEVWDRGPDHPRFLEVRHGLATLPLAATLDAPAATTPHRTDPVAAIARDRLLAAHTRQHRLPAVLDLRLARRVGLEGGEQRARSAARALVCSAAVHHSPERLLVAAVVSERARPQWEWLKWLPHARGPAGAGVLGPGLVTTDPDQLARLLPRDHPHLLLLADGLAADDLADDRVSVIEVASAPRGGADVVDELQLRAEDCDACDPATAEALARRLTALRPATAGPVSSQPEAALPVGDVEALDPSAVRQPLPPGERLRTPIGLDDDGRVVHLDLKETAEHGMGPHGLLVGATGSGKSELLRTLVLGLAARHSPEQLNLVLVDFKGGATFAGLARLPQVSALITNLAAELVLVERMQDALSGELLRRQELLRAAGDFASVRDYEEARTRGADLAPLPSLLIVVDEFSELLTARPEFLDVFVAIGRLGRSLGIHLLLGSQRLDEGRLRGLESHLAYRIGLRTFSAAESLAVLGVRDAQELPPVPGAGYLRTDPSRLVRFQASYVSGPASVRRPAPLAPCIEPFGLGPVPADPQPGQPVATEDGPSLLEVAVDRLAGHGPPAHRVWLPPLDEPDALGTLLGDLSLDARLGLVSRHWREVPGLTVPLGTIDLPREQRREPLTVDLTAAGGHLVVVGGPRSGKTSLLRSLVTGVALSRTPLEVQVFVLDLGGGLGETLALPHVCGAASRAEPGVVRRIVSEVTRILDRRETDFRDQGIDSIESYRERRAAGRTDDGYGDVFVVVDGWAGTAEAPGGTDAELVQLAVRGAAYGIHLVASASRWADLRPATREVFGSRLELRLGDPLDSVIDRRAAAAVPADQPGRGLDPLGRHFLAALPRLDDEEPAAAVTAAWPGPTPPRLRLLPDRVRLADLVAGRSAGSGLLLGIEEHELGAAGVDPGREPHLLVLGEGGSGKTATLRTYLREVVRTRSPDTAQVMVVDYRRTLLGEVSEAHLLDHLSSAARATSAVHQLAAHLLDRLPGEDVTADVLRDRSWWRGPEVFVVVDDHDLVTSGQGSPLAPLVPLLAQAADVGLHLVVARRTGGAGRALHEPMLQALRDLAAPGLLLSGNPEEGPLLGGLRPQPLPPGRGQLVTRDDGRRTLQVAWTDPTA